MMKSYICRFVALVKWPRVCSYIVENHFAGCRGKHEAIKLISAYETTIIKKAHH